MNGFIEFVDSNDGPMESNTDFEPFGKPMDSGVSLFVDPYLGEIECLPETKKLTVEDVLATLKDWNETLGEPVDSAVVNKPKEVEYECRVTSCIHFDSTIDN